MATKKAKRRIRRKPRHTVSDGLVTHGGFALLISGLGLVVAFALLWWQIILEPQRANQAAEQERLLNQYSHLFNGRLADLRGIINAMATSDATIAALASYNPQQQKAMAKQLADQHPYISRVEIIEKGKAEVDLSAEVPISFAALDLVRRAESREFVGPEVGTKQGARIYAAQPITPKGTVGGVLLVVFEKEFMLDPLQYFTNLRGSLQILQTVSGTPTTPVLEVGSTSGNMASIEQQLFVPQWKVSFASSESEVRQVDHSSGLFTPFIVALAFTFAGIFLGFSTFGRKLSTDAETLTEYLTRIVRGRSANPGQYSISTLQNIATAVSSSRAGCGREVRYPTR